MLSLGAAFCSYDLTARRGEGSPLEPLRWLAPWLLRTLTNQGQGQEFGTFQEQWPGQQEDQTQRWLPSRPAEGHVSCRGTRAARPARRAGTSDSFGPARGCKLLTSEARCLALLDQSKPSGLASSPPSFLGPTDSCSNLSPWSCQEIQGWSL